MATIRGRGRTAVPVGSSFGAIALGIVALVAGLTFGGALRHLLDNPELYGVGWDVELPITEPGLPAQLGVDLAQEPGVEGTAIGVTSQGVQVEDSDGEIPLVAMDRVAGEVLPPVLDGRHPDGPQEIALGSETMERLEVEIGDTIEVSPQGGFAGAGREPTELTVVGRTVLPSTGLGAGLGIGGLVTLEGLSEISGVAEEDLLPSLFLNTADDADTGQIARLVADRTCGSGFCTLLSPVRYAPPADVDNFGRAANVPGVMGGVFAVAAVATLVHVVVTSVRRRARDLALFKTLGFSRRQVVLTVLAAATTTVVVALVVGLPLGVAIGRWLWILRAEDLGVEVVAPIPLAAVGLVAVGAVLVANLVGLIPARAAARTRPSEVLHAE